MMMESRMAHESFTTYLQWGPVGQKLYSFFYKNHERTMEETILQEKWFFKEKNPYIFWQNVHNETKPK